MKTLILLLLLPVVSQCQTVDTVITNTVYKSYFNYKLHEPLYVVYKLYKGGGECSRKGMHFTTDNLPGSATVADYARNGFDEGHLCNAEDEAGDCAREAQTFHFYNCVPQTPALNRGIWKVWETVIRKESQTDSLLIICGSIFGDKKIGVAAVPVTCWKIVYSLTTRQLLHCFTFPNDNSQTFNVVTLDELKKETGYVLTW